jgi:hypothetical protein
MLLGEIACKMLLGESACKKKLRSGETQLCTGPSACSLKTRIYLNLKSYGSCILNMNEIPIVLYYWFLEFPETC